MSRVLVVDDNADNRYFLRMLLTGLGHDVALAANGAEALAQARTTPPDLVVSDILMPQMDGFALCRAWKADARLKSVPFMFYTATYTEPKDEAFALSLGADRFVVKPQEPMALGETIVELLERGRTGGHAGAASEFEFVKQHRDAVIRKLEDKMVELEAANAALRRDVAERLRAEEALRASEERYRSLFEQSPVGIYRTTPEGAILLANPALVSMLGYASTEELQGLDLEATGFGADTPRTRFKETLARDGQISGFQSRWVRKDGRQLVVRETAHAVCGEDGRVLHYEGAVEDVSERAKAEEALRRLAAAVDQAAEAVVVTDSEGTIQYVNPAFEQITGYTHAEALGQNPRILKSGKQDDTFYRALWATILDRRVWSGRLINRRKDGSLFEEEATISPVVDEAGVIVNYVAVGRDVTAEQALRQQLTHAQKLEAVGRLAGGIAHDFNNVLQAVLSQIAVLGLRLRGVPGVGKPIEELDQLVRRGAALTRQLLLFSRRETPAREPADLNDLVRGAATLVKRVVREDVTIVTRLADTPLPVMADQGQCDQVLMNLVVNASDAMPEGGTLTLRTGGDEATVWLSVADTGCGIPDAVREHLYEPFFTTKPVGKGTGLGLSVVHGIVAAHGGSVSVSSREGAGTTFTVSLPRLLDPPPHFERPDGVVVIPTGRGERVLLVEDEDGARQSLLEILGSLGYAVTAAASGEEASALPPSPPFDLLLSDLVLPGIAGPDLANHLRERWPRLRVVLMSGYAEEDTLHRLRPEINAEFMQKPFQIAALAESIRRALARDINEAPRR